ncbi:MAG TPA: DUF3817 domain-containing protein [Acidimicrobiales bacterium]|nr:DUF3817 domain-containing protein [Acidimicrobiales bacterium]
MSPSDNTPRRIGQLVAPGYVRSDDPASAIKGLAAALLRYRIMAYVVGVGLLILVFVGVPLQYGATIPQVAQIVGPIHGFLYIVYLLAAVDLARRARFTLLQMAAMIGAGFLPFLAFVIEHQVGKRVDRLIADQTEQAVADDRGTSASDPGTAIPTATDSPAGPVAGHPPGPAGP